MIPGKVFTHVLLARLQLLLDKVCRTQQSGFTSGRCHPLDAILTLRLLSEIHREFRKLLNVAYIDLKAAFDSVDREALWKALAGIGVPNILLDLIQELHHGTTSRVRLGNRFSARFRTSSGVRQGCVLAPALFCCAMDYIMNWVTSGNAGIQLGDQCFTDLDYADDAVLFEESCDKLLCRKWNLKLPNLVFNLHVSWTKTKVQNLGSGAAGEPILIGSETVDSVDSFCYLGSNMCSMANSHDESIRRMGIASSVMQRLDRIWQQRQLSQHTKFRMYVCLVLSTLLYGSETWTMTSQEWKRLEAFHTKAQRRILNIRWFDFICNDEVYKRSGLETVQTIVRRRRLGLFGHVARLPPAVPASAALHLAARLRDRDISITGWNRPRGRPPITWLHQIHGDCGLPISEAFQCAQSRPLWRTIATAERLCV